MEEKKEKNVFILLTEWSNDGETGQNVGVYSDMDKARKEMVSDFERTKKDWSYDEDGRINIATIHPMGAEIASEEFWLWDHCTWQIIPCVVQ